MRLKKISRKCTMCTLTIAAVLAFSALGLAQTYKQTNLVSDLRRLVQIPPPLQPPMRAKKAYTSVPRVRPRA
jgi:hypothetical protein